MRKIFIKEFLEEIGVSLTDISLGDFDVIGEYCAKKMREKNSPLWNSTGAFFRPNYERGILIYSLITKYKLQSYVEVGWGRGFSALCAAKALYDIGSPGKVTTIDVQLDEKQLQLINAVYPKEWLEKINFQQGKTDDILPGLTENYDFIYIDADHRYESVKNDWKNLKGHANRFVLFDDYHFPTKTEKDIECAKAIDEIDWDAEGYEEPSVIVMDRRIFFDDRRISDEAIDYGQAIFQKKQPKLEW